MKYYDAMVIGAGFSGLGCALAIARQQYSVLLMERDAIPGGILKHVCRGQQRFNPMLEMVENNEKITLLTQAKLQSIGGFHPRFSIHWYHNNHSHYTDVGHVIFSMGIDYTFPMELYQPGPGKSVITLPDLENSVCTGNWSPFKNKRILMVGGYLSPDSPYGVHLMIDRSIALANAGAKVYFVLPGVSFDEPDTTLLYKYARENGVLFFKSDVPPALEEISSELSFSVLDETISTNKNPAIVYGTVDMVVFEPKYLPRTLPNVFWSPHHPSRAPNGFYQPNNPKLSPVKSERKGVYYVGAVTGFKSLDQCREEIAIATSEILIKHPVNPPHAEVDDKKCVACLTCIRLCPHRAIHLDGTAKINIDACDGCGICAAECPAKAITMATPHSSNLEKSSLEISKNLPKWVVLYCCEGSSRPTWDSIKNNPIMRKHDIQVVEIPCSGHISVSSLLEHFKIGTSAVLVAACQPSCCDHIHGNIIAGNRVKRVKRILKTLGLNEERIEIIHVAQGMDQYLLTKIDAFCSLHLDDPRNTSVDRTENNHEGNLE